MTMCEGCELTFVSLELFGLFSCGFEYFLPNFPQICMGSSMTRWKIGASKMKSERVVDGN